MSCDIKSALHRRVRPPAFANAPVRRRLCPGVLPASARRAVGPFGKQEGKGANRPGGAPWRLCG